MTVEQFQAKLDEQVMLKRASMAAASAAGRPAKATSSTSAKATSSTSATAPNQSPAELLRLKRIHGCLGFLSKNCSQRWLVEMALKPCGIRCEDPNEFRYVDINNKVKRTTCSASAQTECDDMAPAAKKFKASSVACVDLTADDDELTMPPLQHHDVKVSSSTASSTDPRQRLLSNLMQGERADDVCMLWSESSNEYFSHDQFLDMVAAQFGA